MLFLDFGFFDDIATNVGGIIFDGIRSLCYFLDTIIYQFIIYLYNWFLMLCTGRLLDNDMIETIGQRFGLILGIFMFFTVAISFLRYVVDPDRISDKESGLGSIIKKVIIVVLALALSNTAFTLLYSIQNIILGENESGTNIIQQLLSPQVIDSKDFGTSLALNLFSVFYEVNDSLDYTMPLSEDGGTVADCYTYLSILKNQIAANRNFEFGYNCLNVKADVTVNLSGGQTSTVYVMNFQHVISVIVGLVIVYMLLMYCVKVGVRMVQLAFLEILSPMAIISYLMPQKETMLEKWGKVYISTYIDAFVRVAIINLVVYLIAVVLDGWSSGTGTFWDSISVQNTTTKWFMGVVIIIALLEFARRAPELLKELFPQGGAGSIGYGVGTGEFKKMFAPVGAVATGAVGAVGGAVGGAAGAVAGGGGLLNAAGAAFRGLGHGLTSTKKIGDIGKSVSGGYNANKANALRLNQRLANGGSRFVSPFNQLEVDRLDIEKAEIEAQNSLANNINGHVSTIKDRAKDKILNGDSNSQLAVRAIQAQQEVERLKHEYSQESDEGKRADLAEKIQSAGKEYKTAMDAAITEYVNAKKTTDAVFMNEITAINEDLANNTTGAVFEGGTSDWKELDKLDQSANGVKTTNITRLANNQRSGQQARANQQYGNKGNK